MTFGLSMNGAVIRTQLSCLKGSKTELQYLAVHDDDRLVRQTLFSPPAGSLRCPHCDAALQEMPRPVNHGGGEVQGLTESRRMGFQNSLCTLFA